MSEIKTEAWRTEEAIIGDGGIEEVDVLIVGAGISGIFAARFWGEVHKSARLVVVEKEGCVGGTWNASESSLSLLLIQSELSFLPSSSFQKR